MNAWLPSCPVSTVQIGLFEKILDWLTTCIRLTRIPFAHFSILLLCVISTFLLRLRHKASAVRRSGRQPSENSVISWNIIQAQATTIKRYMSVSATKRRVRCSNIVSGSSVTTIYPYNIGESKVNRPFHVNADANLCIAIRSISAQSLQTLSCPFSCFLFFLTMVIIRNAEANGIIDMYTYTVAEGQGAFVRIDCLNYVQCFFFPLFFFSSLCLLRTGRTIGRWQSFLFTRIITSQ